MCPGRHFNCTGLHMTADIVIASNLRLLAEHFYRENWLFMKIFFSIIQYVGKPTKNTNIQKEIQNMYLKW